MHKLRYSLALSSISLLFLLGCQSEKVPIPKDIGSFSDKQKINSIVSEIEGNLFSLGVDVNLKKLPIIISDGLYGGAGGLCYEGEAIVINKIYLDGELSNTYPGNISALWVTLAHEIGHCYFNREHQDKQIIANEGFIFQRREFWYKNDIQGDLGCTFYYSNYLSTTLMSVNYPVSRVPEEMKLFYLKELIGILPNPSKESVKNFNHFKLIQEEHMPSPKHQCDINE